MKMVPYVLTIRNNQIRVGRRKEGKYLNVFQFKWSDFLQLPAKLFMSPMCTVFSLTFFLNSVQEKLKFQFVTLKQGMSSSTSCQTKCHPLFFILKKKIKLKTIMDCQNNRLDNAIQKKTQASIKKAFFFVYFFYKPTQSLFSHKNERK